MRLIIISRPVLSFSPICKLFSLIACLTLREQTLEGTSLRPLESPGYYSKTSFINSWLNEHQSEPVYSFAERLREGGASWEKKIENAIKNEKLLFSQKVFKNASTIHKSL